LKPVFELAQAIDGFGEKFEQQYSPNAYVQRTLRAIKQCRGYKQSGTEVFLFDMKNLSVVFRGKFMEGLKKEFAPDKKRIRDVYKHKWVVYAKEPFAGPEQVVEYLG
jgi:hypothetical protein